jgi:hypothetical protein
MVTIFGTETLGVYIHGWVTAACHVRNNTRSIGSGVSYVARSRNLWEKNVVFWNIKTQFVPHRGDITSSLQSSAGYCYVRFEVFTAVIVKNIVFCDIKTQFVPHRRHITSPLQSPAGYCYVRFELSTAVTMKNAVSSNVALCGSC